MFSVFPLFSLSTCTSWTCLLWMCAVVPFHLISPPGCGSYQFKTTANMRLLNGFPFFFLFFFFPLYPSPPLSLYSCLSVFIMPWQVFKSNARKSLRWLQMHQGWYPTEGIPLMKRMKGHTAVRQITLNPHCPEYPTPDANCTVLKSQKEKSTLSVTEFDTLVISPHQKSTFLWFLSWNRLFADKLNTFFSSASYYQAGETNQTILWILNISLLHLGL